MVDVNLGLGDGLAGSTRGGTTADVAAAADITLGLGNVFRPRQRRPTADLTAAADVAMALVCIGITATDATGTTGDVTAAADINRRSRQRATATTALEPPPTSPQPPT